MSRIDEYSRKELLAKSKQKNNEIKRTILKEEMKKIEAAKQKLKQNEKRKEKAHSVSVMEPGVLLRSIQTLTVTNRKKKLQGQLRKYKQLKQDKLDLDNCNRYYDIQVTSRYLSFSWTSWVMAKANHSWAPPLPSQPTLDVIQSIEDIINILSLEINGHRSSNESSTFNLYSYDPESNQNNPECDNSLKGEWWCILIWLALYFILQGSTNVQQVHSWFLRNHWCNIKFLENALDQLRARWT